MSEVKADFKITQEYRIWFWDKFGWMAEDSWVKMKYLEEVNKSELGNTYFFLESTYSTETTY